MERRSPTYAELGQAGVHLQSWSFILILGVLRLLVQVMMEWCTFEAMVLMSGLLANPSLNVATMGICFQVTSLIYMLAMSLAGTRQQCSLASGKAACRNPKPKGCGLLPAESV
jgi:hypothetical protein